MPTWLTIQLLLICFWVIVGFLFYRGKAWKAGFPFNKNNAIRLVYLFVVSAWAISSIIAGVIYVLSSGGMIFAGAIVCLIVIPFIVLIRMGYKIGRTEKQADSEENAKNLLIKNKEMQCIEWLSQFPFLKKEMYEIKIHALRDKPSGHISVFNLSKDEANKLQANVNGLPEGIELWAFTSEKPKT